MKKSKNILISPLSWGLGHTSRIIPIIYYLLKSQQNVIIAGDTDIINFIKHEFPNIKHVFLPTYKVKLSKRKSQALIFFFLIPKIVFYTIKEHFELKKIISDNNIDMIISDNRYGLWNKHVWSILITHQRMIKLPSIFRIFEFPVYLFLRLLISNFDKCWIPDFENDKNLSGDLSNKYPVSSNLEYIGPLSRFLLNSENKKSSSNIDILCILSGPEPQRTIFENILINQLSILNKNSVIVRGTNSMYENHKKTIENIKIFDICNSKELKSLIDSSSLIICRSGYSSVMDLMALNKKAVLVPTPGQTEQEYLAKYLQKQNWFYSVSQSNLNISSVLYLSNEYSCNNIFNSHELLNKAINRLALDFETN
ncbi:MAG: glycosyltransferase [Bacteroidales bacterium]|nr:glycosyltransferase [Bacteroidales bacterium]